MTEKKAPEDVVKDLLESFQEADSTPAASNDKNVVIQGMELNEDDLRPFCNPEGLTQLLTLLVSLIGTILGAGFSGFAHMVREDMLPHIGKLLATRPGYDNPEAIRFVKKLLRDPLRQIAQEDAKREPSQQRVPVMLEELISKQVSLAVAMYVLGTRGTPLRSDAMASVIHRLSRDMLKNAGVAVEHGTLSERLPLMVKELTDAATAEYEKHKNDEP